MNKDIELICETLENSNLIKTNNKLYWDLWNVIEKHKKEIA